MNTTDKMTVTDSRTVAGNYLQVKLNDGKRLIIRNPKTIVIGIVECLSGIEVNNQGDEITAKNFDQRQHIIEKSNIKSLHQLKWNLKYGTLEPAVQNLKF